MKSATTSWMIVVVLSSLLAFCVEAGTQSDPNTYRGGIRNSTAKQRLKEKDLQRVVESLKEKTGFQSLGFDADGYLTLADRQQIVGGSATARQLLLDAMNATVQLVLENHNHSSKVVFANLGKGTMYMNMRTNARMEHLPICIDFSDFGKLVGSKEVLASFDLGITLLHELVHGVHKLHDSVNEWEELGDCERFVNTIRKELSLPERQQYIARSHNVISPVGWTMKIAELQFARTDFRNGRLKTEEYKLSWDVTRVGAGEPESIQRTLNAAGAKKPEQKSSAAIQ